MALTWCNRNPGFLKLFLGVNIILFIYAISRLRFTTSDVEQPVKNINAQPSRIRTLEFLQNAATCNCDNNEYKINQLQSKVEDLTTSLDKERTLRRINECGSQLKKSDKSTRTVMPTKIGDDAKFQVANIVHYIWYNTETKPFEFHHMLSVLSVHKFIKPDLIYFHTDNPPSGPYWDRIKTLPPFKINKREPPTEIFGEKVKPPAYHTSHSNVDRVLVLMEYGGIYMDFDFYAVRSFDDLRKHICTVGLESDTKVCGSVIICSKDSFFLYLWINAYLDDYRIDEWAYNTGKVPFKLANRYPHLVNVEKTRLNRPNFQELSQIWVKPTWWKWRDSYGFHSWYRLWKEDWGGYFKGIEPDENNVKTLNNTFGEIARVILYDTAEFIT